MLKTLITLILFILSINAYSVRCFVTGVKASCWESYNVTINVVDTKNDQKLATIIIPAQNIWSRQEFECSPGQNIRLDATFTPDIWEKHKGRVYSGLNFWKLPVTPPKDKEVWHLSVCFPNHFSQVPLPPEAGHICECNMKDVEPLKL